jgi:recombination protein RecA
MAKKEQVQLNLKGLSFKAIAKQINSVYGANTLAIASEAEGLIVQFFSTGVYAIDLVTGGGIPKNRITEIFGAYSALKSTVVYNTIANFQRAHPEGKAFVEDGELSFDPNYSKLCGCDNDRIGILNADSGEQAIDVIRQLMSDNVDLFFAIDSIASLVPTAEIESSAEQQFQGLHPRLVGKLMRLLRGGMKRNMYDMDAAKITVVATNQTREKIGVMYGNPETTPGGKAKDFYYSMRLRFSSSPSDAVLEKVVRNGVERECRVGQVVKFSVRKNKVSGSQFEEGDFVYYVRPYKGHRPYTFNNEDVLFKFGVFYGIIQRVQSKKDKNKMLFKYGPLCRAQDSKFKDDLVKDPRLCEGLYREIMSAIVEEHQSGLTPELEVGSEPEVKLIKN